jgi:hypothetical protein
MIRPNGSGGWRMVTVQTRLNGFFAPDLATDRRLVTRIGEFAGGMLPPQSTQICDARGFQGEGVPEADFFEQYGFVLLRHESAVTDWNVESDPSATGGVRIYPAEIEAVIRSRLLPARRIEIQQNPFVVRRGRGTANPAYGNGVHQDFGLTPEDYRQSIEAFTSPEIARYWRARYDREEVEGFVMLDFWRTTGMDRPLKHMPLAFCDPNSVDIADVIPTGLSDLSPTGKSPTIWRCVSMPASDGIIIPTWSAARCWS